MRQPIGSRLHGVLDYLTGSSLIAASRLPVLRGRFAGRALGLAGAGHVAYSLLTNYELAPIRAIPYKAHLALDAGGAAGLAAAPWVIGKRSAVDRWLPVAVGAYELSAVLLSDPEGEGAGPGRGELGHRAVTVQQPAERVRAVLEDPAAIERFSPDGRWSRRYELRDAPGGRGTEIHAEADPADLRRAKQLIEAGEIATAQSPAGRRGALSGALPTLDQGA